MDTTESEAKRDPETPAPQEVQFSSNSHLRVAAEQRWRLRIVSALFPALLFFVLLLLRISIPFDEYRARNRVSVFFLLFEPERFLLLESALGLLALTAVLMLYLQTGFRRPNLADVVRLAPDTSGRAWSSDTDRELKGLVQTVQLQLHQLLLQQGNAPIQTTHGVDSNPSASSPGKMPQKTAGQAECSPAPSLLGDATTRIHVAEMLARLSRERQALGFRGNLNLSIGITTTAAGIILLFYFVSHLPSTPPQSAPVWYLAAFLPRLTVVVLIEVFAYFFLGLYKATLSETKYFQNEMTNIEARALALEAAVTHGDPATQSAVVMRWAETERNYMKKGETTAELERSRAEREDVTEALHTLVTFLRKEKEK